MMAPTQTAAPQTSDVTSAFKEVMRSAPAAVALLTSRDLQGKPHGMAASSLISVSMHPPSLLVAINRSAGLHSVLCDSRQLCVNLLAQGHGRLLEAFSRSDQRAQRFSGSDWRDLDSGLPWLSSAVAAVFGRIDQVIDYATHTIFIVRVEQVRRGSMAPGHAMPLVWFEGRCMSLMAPDLATTLSEGDTL